MIKMQSYATLKIGESMKELDKKTKKKMYFALILVGLDLLLMGILCIVSNYIPSIPKGIVLGPFGILLWSFIINLVSSIYFLISGIKTKEKILIFLAPLFLIPIPAWFFAGSQIINNIPLDHSWDKPALYLYPEQEENELMIIPKPDSLLRVAINIKKVDKEVKTEEQELPHFTREGFTAVEWGGTICE